jgi:hypothetical protein
MEKSVLGRYSIACLNIHLDLVTWKEEISRSI